MNQPSASQDRRFEIDPFVSQLALCIDKGVTDEKPEFKAIVLAERLNKICRELRERGVVVYSDEEAVPIWKTAPAIESRIGGVKVSNNVQFTLSNTANVVLRCQFQAAVTISSAGQLESMLETTVTLFELCNMGKMTIASIDADGFYQWDLFDGESGGVSD
jgi:hypothetical protein